MNRRGVSGLWARIASFAAGVVLGALALTGSTASAHTYHPGAPFHYVRVWNWGTVKGHPGCYAWTGYVIFVRCADEWTETISPVPTHAVPHAR